MTSPTQYNKYMKVQLTVRFLNWAGYSPSKGQTSTLLLLNIESINPATKNKNHTWRITTLSWKAASGKAMLVTIMSSDATATSPSKKLRTAVPTTKKQEEDMRNCSPVNLTSVPGEIMKKILLKPSPRTWRWLQKPHKDAPRANLGWLTWLPSMTQQTRVNRLRWPSFYYSFHCCYSQSVL